MQRDQNSMAAGENGAPEQAEAKLLLAVDTCGLTGTVAIGGIQSGAVEILGQTELEGRTYSATLISAIAQLLERTGIRLAGLGAIVAVNGPGSFTGVRVGLSAVKGMAEPEQIPVVAVSRLEVLAWKSGVASSALDAHRQEIFLRMAPAGAAVREFLAGADEFASILASIGQPPAQIATCDEPASMLLQSAWPSAELIRVPAPSAADALELCAARVEAGCFIDLALLDAHYLRRSDAEIFGEAAKARPA